MSAKAIYEAKGKELLNKYLKGSCFKNKYVIVTEDVNWAQLEQDNQWLLTQVNCRKLESQAFFCVIFHISSLMHVRIVVCGFGKKRYVRTGVRKPGSHRCITDYHDITLDVKTPMQTKLETCYDMGTAFGKSSYFTRNTLPNNKIFDMTELEAFADDKIDVAEMMISVLKGRKHVGKGENAGYQHFPLFPQCFQKIPFLGGH